MHTSRRTFLGVASAWLAAAAVPRSVGAADLGPGAHALGLDQHKLWYLNNGRNEKLTDFGGKVIEKVFA